ncbi:hypothetical protein BKA80DRAFT_270594 [Phyllosticta citrichinensis]
MTVARYLPWHDLTRLDLAGQPPACLPACLPPVVFPCLSPQQRHQPHTLSTHPSRCFALFSSVCPAMLRHANAVPFANRLPRRLDWTGGRKTAKQPPVAQGTQARTPTCMRPPGLLVVAHVHDALPARLPLGDGPGVASSSAGPHFFFACFGGARLQSLCTWLIATATVRADERAPVETGVRRLGLVWMEG